MSILIKGMKMPKDCPMCPLSHWNKLDEFTGCEVVNGKRFAVTNDKGYAQSNTRPSWCPLVEIPPHGRLIDADKLEDVFSGLGDRAYRRTKGTIMDAQKFLSYAPTVIESEEHKCVESESEEIK